MGFVQNTGSVKEQIGELKSNLVQMVPLKIGNPQKYNGYFNEQGEMFVDGVNHSIVTDYIPVKKGDIFYYKGLGDLKAISVAHYDNEKKLISYEKCNNLFTYKEIIISADNCEYVRFSSYSKISDDIVFDIYSYDNVSGNMVNILKNELDALRIENLGECTNYNIDTSELIQESIHYDGTVKPYEGWYSTSMINIGKYSGGKIILDDIGCYISTKIVINAVSFFDSEKQYISGISYNCPNNCTFSTVTDGRGSAYYYSMANGIADIPSNAVYIRISYYEYTAKTDQLLHKSGTKIRLKYNVDKLITDVNALKSSDLSGITVMCVGDSITEGDYGSEPAGKMNLSDENYPYFLQKYLKCNVSNQGKCGYTPIAYWENKIKTIDFDSIKPDIVIIMLGTNGSMTDTLEYDTDYDSYVNYANTGTGDYCKIIEYINEHTNGQAQIFICTCPYVDASRREQYAANILVANVVIPKIADKYNLPLIDVNKELGLSFMNTHVMQPIDGLHFGKIGYSRLGTYIGSKIKSVCSFTFGN